MQPYSKNYYEVLECQNDAPFDDLKKSYQRLVLASHPDKASDVSAQSDFYLIQEAWNVLRDPVARKQYDARLVSQDHNELLLYDTVLLSEMSAAGDNYTYTCRCGGTYTLEAAGIFGSEVIIECDECSFSIKVLLQSR